MIKVIAVFVLIFPAVALAQSISGVSGTISDGQTITISGSSFGAGGTLITWDNFESGSDGDFIENRVPPTGPTWDSPWVSGAIAPDISSYRSVSGDNSARVCWNDGTTSNWASYFGWTGQGPYTSIYFTYYRYLAGGGGAWETGSINHKTAYIFGTVSDHPQITVGATMNGGVWYETTNGGVGFIAPNDLSGGAYLVSNSTFNWDATKSVWQRWEVYAEINEPYSSSNDVFQSFHDYRLIADESSVRLAAEGAYDDFRIGHMDNSYAGYDSLYAYFDDIYISTSRARVELGDNGVFSGCAKREIQIPTAWASGEITITVNQGTFQAEDSAYLFVVDADGSVSSGYAVTIGGAASSPTITAPTNLTATKVE